MFIPIVNHNPSLPLQATKGSCGWDLFSRFETVIEPHDSALISTGIYIQIPPDHVGLICPRSGLALNYKITVLNSPGVIDSDYRGEIKVLLFNHCESAYKILANDRIAQLLILSVTPATFREVENLSPTERGEGGFGSTK